MAKQLNSPSMTPAFAGAMISFAMISLTCLLSACDQSDSSTPPTEITIETPAPQPSATTQLPYTTDIDVGEVEMRVGTADDPIELVWEDLMPEGSEEELYRQYEEFYSDLEQKLVANSTMLSDVTPGPQGIAEGSTLDYMPQFGSFDVVSELDQQHVRIPGYIVPLEFETERKHTEFLFVPYTGACIHYPPPPPNQIIFVRADPGIVVKEMWDPYWLEGVLNAETTNNDLGNTAYTLDLTKLKPFSLR